MLSVYGVIKMAAVGGRVARGPARTLPRDWVPTAHFQLMIPLTNVWNKCPCDGNVPVGHLPSRNLCYCALVWKVLTLRE